MAASKFDILDYLSGMTNFVFDKSALNNVALDCGVSDVESYLDLTEEQKLLEAEKQRLREIQPALNRAEELGYPNMELLKTKTKKEIFDIMTIWKATEGK